MELWIQIYSELLRDWFVWAFPPDAPGGPCKVSASSVIGKLLIAYAKPVIQPEPKPEGITLNVVLPEYGNTTSMLKNHYLSISKAQSERLNFALRAEFDLDFRCYYRRGLELGIPKKDIVEAFILSRHLADLSFDTLHKRIYRRDINALNSLSKKLLNKLYSIDRAIDLTGLEYDKNHYRD